MVLGICWVLQSSMFKLARELVSLRTRGLRSTEDLLRWETLNLVKCLFLQYTSFSGWHHFVRLARGRCCRSRVSPKICDESEIDGRSYLVVCLHETAEIKIHTCPTCLCLHVNVATLNVGKCNLLRNVDGQNQQWRFWTGNHQFWPIWRKFKLRLLRSLKKIIFPLLRSELDSFQTLSFFLRSFWLRSSSRKEQHLARGKVDSTKVSIRVKKKKNRYKKIKFTSKSNISSWSKGTFYSTPNYVHARFLRGNKKVWK